MDRIRKEFQPRERRCRDKHGKVLGEEKVILNRWAEHFSDLLNKSTVPGNGQLDFSNPSNGQTAENLMNPTRQEVVEVIIKMKNNKAPGEDGIVAEMIKYGGEGLENAIHKLIHRTWDEEIMPESSKMGMICPIFKKGDKLACENYRGGFRPQRSTTDQIFIIRQIMEKFYEHECDLNMLFINIKQAFDSLRRDELYKALKEMNLPEKLIRLVWKTPKHESK